MIDRCSICPRKYLPISGDGPQPAPVLCIGERPGKDENKYGRVFIGKTGQEFDRTYLPACGLDRSSIRVCNVVRCWADDNRTPTSSEIMGCAQSHIPAEIRSTRPEVIVLLGGSACRIAEDVRLDTHHGIPRRSSLFNWEGWIVPMFHPALGLHESRWMTMILEDWERLGRFLNNTYSHPDPHPVTDYKLIRTPRDLNDYAFSSVVAVDTERHGNTPYSIQCSPSPGRAFMVLAEDREVLYALSERLHDLVLLLHNAGQDLDILERMGIRVSDCSYQDTMQEAYHQGNLPQGLKPLVYRLFGYTMTSWEDVVRPASISALNEWMSYALDIARCDLSLTEVKRLKTKLRETVKKGPLEQLLTRLIQNTDVASDYDPWERLHEFWSGEVNEWMTSHVESRIGRYPILGIGNAKLDRAVEYACGDADWTGQVAQELGRRREDKFWSISSEDIDQ